MDRNRSNSRRTRINQRRPRDLAMEHVLLLSGSGPVYGLGRKSKNNGTDRSERRKLSTNRSWSGSRYPEPDQLIEEEPIKVEAVLLTENQSSNTIDLHTERKHMDKLHSDPLYTVLKDGHVQAVYSELNRAEGFAQGMRHCLNIEGTRIVIQRSFINDVRTPNQIESALLISPEDKMNSNILLERS